MTEEMKANDASRYCVINLQPDCPPARLYLGSFDNEGEARKHAEQIAAERKGDEIAVYQKIGSARLVPSVQWKGASR